MELDLYKQAVRLIKCADGTSSQSTFYSDPGNSGLIMYPRGVIDRTADFNPGSDYARNISLLMQKNYSDGDYGIRSGNVQGEWKGIESAGKDQDPELPTVRQVLNLQKAGLTFDDPRVKGLGNNPDVYTFSNDGIGSYYRNYPVAINYDPSLFPDRTTEDSLRTLAHETAHRRSLQWYDHITNPSYNNDSYKNWRDVIREYTSLHPWQGYYNKEWPSIVNEWTYGQPGGTIHPQMTTFMGKVTPMRSFTASDLTTDLYLTDLFPLVSMRQLKSQPGQTFRYWHAPNEPDKPSGYKKRIVYDTPSGWWVNQFGRWERTGGDVFDPKYYFKDNMNISQLPPNLQRHIYNMSFLNLEQPSDDRQIATNELREQLRDLLAPLGLRRQYRHSGGRTLGELIANSLEANNIAESNAAQFAYSSTYGDSPEDIEASRQDRERTDSLNASLRAGARQHFWLDPERFKQEGRMYMGVKDEFLQDTNEAIEKYPMWNPNMTLEPIPIGLAGLQKKYSISPTVDEPSDWRSSKQYKAMIRDAQHSYDLQNELDTYGPKDGGRGS